MIQSPDSLYKALGTTKTEVQTILTNLQSHYYEYSKIKYDKTGRPRYTKFGTPAVRTITPSKNKLKILQKRICKLLNQKITSASYAFGSIKGRNGIMNARYHQGNKFIFQTDLRSFFPSIPHQKVYQMFIDLSFSPDVATILTKLTTYKGHIPQGAPTSAMIANLVFTTTGDKLATYCSEHKLKFSTYVDDITISGSTDFKDKIPEILNIIKQDGYTISHAKTTYKTNHPEITGVKVGNNYLDITDTFREKINNPQNKTAAQIAGMRNYQTAVLKANSPTLQAKPHHKKPQTT